MFPPRHFQEPHLLWRAATRHFVPATKATWKPQMTSEAPTTYACRHDIVKPSRRVRSADSPTPTSDCTQIMYTFMRTKSGSVRQFSFSQWKTFSMWNVPTWLRHVMSCHVMSRCQQATEDLWNLLPEILYEDEGKRSHLETSQLEVLMHNPQSHSVDVNWCVDRVKTTSAFCWWLTLERWQLLNGSVLQITCHYSTLQWMGKKAQVTNSHFSLLHSKNNTELASFWLFCAALAQSMY